MMNQFMRVEEIKGKVDFGIITIREDEFKAVLQRFPTIDNVRGNRIYGINRLKIDNSDEYLIAVVRCAEQGEGEAQDVTRDMIEDLDPKWILLIGIAGGVPEDEFTLGDVVVAIRLQDFCIEVAKEGSISDYAVSGGPMHKHVQIVLANLQATEKQLQGWNDENAIGMPRPSVKIHKKYLYGNEEWQKKVRSTLEKNFGHSATPRAPIVKTAVVASSDRLVKDTELLKRWQKAARHIWAIEMELAGVYRAARRIHKEYPVLAIRGISDIVGFNRDPDWTTFACHNAASFAHAFLKAKPIDPISKQSGIAQAYGINKEVEKSELRTEVCQLLKEEVKYLEQECARRTLNKSLEDIFVGRNFAKLDPTIDEISEGNYHLSSYKKRKWSDLIEQIEDKGAIILIGDAGFGKTISLLQEVKERCRKGLDFLKKKETPLDDLEFGAYFQANDIAGTLVSKKIDINGCIVKLLTERHRLDSKNLGNWLLDKLRNGHILLAFDALDEVHKNYEETLNNELNAFTRWNDSYRLLFTSRRVGYTIPPVPYVSEWIILPFNKQQLSIALHKWFINSFECGKKFRKMIKNTPPLEDLLKNPVLFMFTCQEWEKVFEERTAKNEPAPTFSSRNEIYLRSIERFHRRWINRMKTIGNQPNETEKVEFRNFVEELAWQLWSHDPQGSIFTGSEIIDLIENIPKSTALAKRGDLFGDICGSGFLTKVSAGSDFHYQFVHKTLLEYLAASYAARNLEKKGDNSFLSTIKKHLGSFSSHEMLWMLAGILKDANNLFKEVINWTNKEFNSLKKGNAKPHILMHTELLVNFLYEYHSSNKAEDSKIDRELVEDAWNLIVIGLDRLQRKKRDIEWKEISSWNLLYRALSSIELHEGLMSSASQMLILLNDIRSVPLEQDGQPVVVSLKDRDRQLDAGYNSHCPIVRWTAVWATAALNERALDQISDNFTKKLIETIQCDDNTNVSSLAARALVQMNHPQAFDILKNEFNGQCKVTVAGAAMGLGRLATKEATDLLIEKAKLLFETQIGDTFDPLPGAVIGALGTIVGKSRENKIRWSLNDKHLAGIFMNALNFPMPIVKSAAAYALGTMRWKNAWKSLMELFEMPDRGECEMLIMRSTAAKACVSLCMVLDNSDLPGASEFFHQLLRNKQENQEIRRSAASGLL